MVVRNGFQPAESVRNLLVKVLVTGGNGEFALDADWMANYSPIADWLDEFESGLLPHT